VRDVQRSHGPDRGAQRFVGSAIASHRLSRRPQRAEDLRAIEPLPFTVIAEAHLNPPSIQRRNRLPRRLARPS
jgi:hypothetical protein